jgi:hypothetical protein
MQIVAQNNLLTLSLLLGNTQNKHGDIELKVLFDMYGAFSTGFKPYHDRMRCMYQ